MALQKRIILAALTLASIFLIATVLATLLTTKTIPSSGTISAYKVGVYQEAACTNPVTSITFDQVSPSYNTNYTIFIKNDSPIGGKSFSLSMTIPTWTCTPQNVSYNVALFTFNQTGTILAPQEYCAANITLSAPDNAETEAGLTFSSININIIGTES
jgi:hypothetical protein